MSPINLVLYADHSQKLPTKSLSPTGPIKQNTNWKILAAHFIDFTIAFSTSTFMSVIFGKSVKFLLITNGLRAAFSQLSLMPLEVLLLPIILLSYFFLSHFLNHGQTPGMMIFKCRISMPHQNYQESFRWALHSTMICLTMGVSYLFTKHIWNNFKGQDYLYDEMMLIKETSGMNLLSKIEEWKETTDMHDTTPKWQDAA